MKIWLPYVVCGSGTDVFTRRLEKFFNDAGHPAVATPYAHNFQYAPRLLKRMQPPGRHDIVLTNSWNGFAFRRDDRPVVTVEHLCVFDPALRPYTSFAQRVFHRSIVFPHEKLSFDAATKSVAVSEYTGRAAQAAFRCPAPHVIHNGVDTQFFSPDPAPAREHGPFRILFIGNLTKRKGADLLSPIMERLGERFELLYTSGLRGNGVLRPLPNMRAIGRLNQSQMRDAYRACDVALFPSRLEGLSYAAAEAMACGLPLVASNSSSFPEMIDDGINGRLCAVDDVEAFVAAIRQYEQDRATHAGARAAARETAEKKFDAVQMGRRYIELLERVLDER